MVNVETVNGYGKNRLFCITCYLCISIWDIQLSDFSTKKRYYYYYY